MGTKFDRYRIDEGDRVDLSELPTRDDAAFDGDKDEANARLAELRDEIAVLQGKLYAEDRQRLLVVLQAMDTAGKDSTIRDVFKETSPNGVHTSAFGRPESSRNASTNGAYAAMSSSALESSTWITCTRRTERGSRRASAADSAGSMCLTSCRAASR